MLAQCWLPLAGCCLLLLSVMVTTLRGRDRGRQVILLVEVVLLDRENDRRVLAIDFDAEVRLITCERCGVGQADSTSPAEARWW